MGLPLAVTVTLTQISCGECGGTYAINERYRQQSEQEARCWTCPYCRASWGYPGKTEAQKERDRHQATLARLNDEKAARERLERKLKRVNRGVCPECNRSFQNLAQHMKCKHQKKAPH